MALFIFSVLCTSVTDRQTDGQTMLRYVCCSSRHCWCFHTQFCFRIKRTVIAAEVKWQVYVQGIGRH